MQSYRIGSGAGYAGDRIDPAQDLAERGRLDALVFECLAERTIALAQLRKQREPGHGYDPMLEERMRAVLPACLRNRTRVISNMGAANPLAAGAAVIAVGRELGLQRLKVAVLTGDDVLPWIRAHDVPLLEAVPLPGESAPGAVGSKTKTCSRASELGDQLISANAYLGADAMLPALASGADVIITGRVADPALFLAPLMHHFQWPAEDWPRLGQGVLIGHLLECAGQVTGGYIADPGRVDVPDLHELGFPLAEVQPDGTACITKLPGTGGRVDRLTCTAQLLYEIEDPSRYLQPDVVADFSQVQLLPQGIDRMQVSGASGTPRPQQLKASLGYRDGYIGEGQISYAGPGAVARGRLAQQVLQHRLQRLGWAAHEHRTELIGVDAMHGAARGGDREPYEVRLRLAMRCATPSMAQRVGQEVEALYLNGPAAGGGVTVSVREVVAVASALVPRAATQPHVHLLTL